MPVLKVRNVSLPLRCEICHQADRFDARLNFCSRCAGSAPLEVHFNPGAVAAESEVRISFQTHRLMLRIKVCCLMGFCGFFVGSLGRSPGPAVTFMFVGILIGILLGFFLYRSGK
jgi:hypothetical protein